MRANDNAYMKKLTSVKGMAQAGLPMVGFVNLLLDKESVVDADVLGESYLEIIKKYHCCGNGNRPHYMRVKLPGGKDSMVFRRFFDGLSGMQFYANRIYGVVTFDCSAFDDEIDPVALEHLKEFLVENKNNMRFILSGVPQKAIRTIIGWPEFDIYTSSVESLSPREFLENRVIDNGNIINEGSVYIERILSKFPESAWDKVIDYLGGMGINELKSICGEDEEYSKYEERRMGFHV